MKTYVVSLTLTDFLSVGHKKAAKALKNTNKEKCFYVQMYSSLLPQDDSKTT